MKKKNIAVSAIVVCLACALLSLPLTGCGGESSSSGSSGSSSTSTSSSAPSSSSSSSSASNSSSSSSNFTISKDEVTEAYMGTDTAGEGVYWISNADGSKAGLFILATSGDYVSFMGKATVDGNVVTVTDAVSGNAVAIAVIPQEDGTVKLTGAVAMTNGTTAELDATVAKVSVDDCFKIIQGISAYANMIA